MLLEKLNDPNWVKENLAEIVQADKKIKEIIEGYKERIKYERKDIPFNGGVVKLSSYKKFKPKDLDVVMRRYPITMNRSLYNISLSAEAAETITDDDVFVVEMVDRVSFKLNETNPDGGMNDTD